MCSISWRCQHAAVSDVTNPGGDVGHLVCDVRAGSKLDHWGAALGGKAGAWPDGGLKDRGGWVTGVQGALAACTSWGPPGRPAQSGPGIQTSPAAQLVT